MIKTTRAAAMQTVRIGAANVLRVVPVVAPRSSRKSGVRVAAAVQFDYDTKIFKKELVKFADTEEYIYRRVNVQST